jgi:hypothetical protein
MSPRCPVVIPTGLCISLQVEKKAFETKEAAAAAMGEAYGDRSGAPKHFSSAEGVHATVVEKVQQDHELAGYQIDKVCVVEEREPATNAEKRPGKKKTGPATGKYIVARFKACRAMTPEDMYTTLTHSDPTHRNAYELLAEGLPQKWAGELDLYFDTHERDEDVEATLRRDFKAAARKHFALELDDTQILTTFDSRWDCPGVYKVGARRGRRVQSIPLMPASSSSSCPPPPRPRARLILVLVPPPPRPPARLLLVLVPASSSSSCPPPPRPRARLLLVLVSASSSSSCPPPPRPRARLLLVLLPASSSSSCPQSSLFPSPLFVPAFAQVSVHVVVDAPEINFATHAHHGAFWQKLWERKEITFEPDMTAYTRNKKMRMYLCTKLGKAAPLLPLGQTDMPTFAEWVRHSWRAPAVILSPLCSPHLAPARDRASDQKGRSGWPEGVRGGLEGVRGRRGGIGES